MQDVHAYKLLAQGDIDACLALAQPALHEWKAGWHPDSAIALACIDTAQAGELAGAWAAYGPAENAIWVRRQDGFERQFERALFDSDHAARNGDRRDSELAGKVAAGALAEIEAAILAQFAAGKAAPTRADLADPPARLLRRSAGTAVVRLSSGGKSLDFFVPQTQLPVRKKANRQHAAAPTPLTPLPVALSGCEARLTVQLGETEISLGGLASLALGDVLRLPASINEPLKIISGTGRQIALGYLGRQDGCRAVEILAVPQ